MQRVLLLRRWITDESTGGLLFGPSGMQLHSLEPPWKDNQIGVSCIPEGKYECTFRNSPRFGWTYILHGTEPRSYILFHAGNFPRDTDGCILVGKSRSENTIWRSQFALKEFHQVLGGDPFNLEIVLFPE